MARRRRPISSPRRHRVNAPGRRRRVVAGPKRRAKAKAAPKPVEMGPLPAVRIGHGWDLHRLEPIGPGGGRELVIGGVRIAGGAEGRGPVAHSDGDVLYHAVTDALLGALGLPDIGELFPDKAAANEGRDSADFVHEAVRRVVAAGYTVGNIDCTVICEKPRIGPMKEQVRLNLALLLGVSPDRVNIKGKTNERVDAVGEGRAIEAHAVVVLLLKTK